MCSFCGINLRVITKKLLQGADFYVKIRADQRNRMKGCDFMKCPACGHPESKVLDSRPANEGNSIRRRRECLKCQKRFTTFETIESVSFVVVKKDKTRESFDRMKLLNGLVRACEKRPVTMSQLENAVSDIEQSLQATMKNEISTTEIGELVMDKLKELDEVAYVRFASVYRQFKDITTFRDELNKLLDK